MPLPESYCRLQLIVQLEGKFSSNYLWYMADPPEIGQSLVQDFATAADAKFSGPYKNVLAANASYYGNFVDANDAVGHYTAFDDSGEGPGTGDAEPLPNQDSVIIRKHLEKKNNRFSRGRMFVAGCPESAFEENAMDDTLYAVMIVLASCVDDIITTGSTQWKPVVLNQSDGSSRFINSVSVQREIRTLRRRRPSS